MARNCLQAAELTTSDRPALLPTEIKCSLLSAVDLECEDLLNFPHLKSGLLILTTHRLFSLRHPSCRHHPHLLRQKVNQVHVRLTLAPIPALGLALQLGFGFGFWFKVRGGDGRGQREGRFGHLFEQVLGQLAGKGLGDCA
ncbi:vacuolar protein sorting-associated protein 36 [Prunus yedoensis var. nudiflora]|uniref:Vacuolar protein sorting-associated protein 36 n=1 Tax=Prunus yedoensis var. nudiflora TaxID=2094558 RepID=A0A314URJ8_PRUYE|nr:vacuolar protein sorting-associated protein 36 [Prunus yedoensis var. nudiflora]